MAINFLSAIAVDSDVLYTDTTNNRVGIGTTSPGAKFHVSGGAIRIDDSQQLQFGNGNVRINNDASGRMYLRAPLAYYFEGNGGYKMVLDGNSGNLGIGTTSPSQKLDVAGDARVEGRIYSNATALASVGILGKAIANGWAARYDSNNANYSGFYFDANNDASMILRDDTGNMNVYLRSDSTSYLNGGNVGIGTTSPALKLEVEGGDALLQLSTASSTGNPYMTFSQAGTRRSFIQHRDSGDNLKIASEYGSISLFTGTGGTETERVTILSGGNVGIGLTPSSEKLEVLGNVSASAFIGDGSQLTGITTSLPAGVVSGSDQVSGSFVNLDGDTMSGDLTVSGSIFVQNNITSNELIVEATNGSDWFTVSNGNVNFNANGGQTNAGAGSLGARFNISPVNDSLPTLAVRGFNGGTSDVIRVSSPTQTTGDYLKVTNAGEIIIGTGDLTIVSSSLSYQENLDVDTGTEVIATVETASFDSAFFDYTVKNGTNLRAGTVVAVHDGTNVEYFDNSTADLGNTNSVTMSVDISGGNLRLLASTSTDNWIIKSFVRGL